MPTPQPVLAPKIKKRVPLSQYKLPPCNYKPPPREYIFYPKPTERLIPDLPYLKAEILHAATHEGALSVEDVLLRRTRISFEAADSGAEAAMEVAKIIGDELGWGAKERKASVHSFLEVIAQEEAALVELVNS